ncbi:MAG: hypothetical protein OEQ24_12370 [Gammaproteobacteria bacterium]|nr:hypothetical protein [Gammaproteobacteria bacterium]
MNETKDNNTKKPVSLLSKITDRDSALKVIKETSLVFIIVGIYQLVVYYLLGHIVILIDAALHIFFGFALREWKSRAAAVILLIQAVIAAVVSIMNHLGYTNEDGVSTILVVAVLFIAVRAVEATFKLHGKYSTDT